MDFDVNSLDDRAAMWALSEVTERWFAERGLEANQVLRRTERYAQRNALTMPDWATDSSDGSPEAGRAAKIALQVLLEDDEEEVRAWTRDALARLGVVQAQVIDPLSIGLILGGLVLAARVKRISKDGVEFYEGIPPELAKVLKAGASFFGLVAG
jgi:uncharacterized protein YfaQ (DUF2300 family)